MKSKTTTTTTLTGVLLLWLAYHSLLQQSQLACSAAQLPVNDVIQSIQEKRLDKPLRFDYDLPNELPRESLLQNTVPLRLLNMSDVDLTPNQTITVDPVDPDDKAEPLGPIVNQVTSSPNSTSIGQNASTSAPSTIVPSATSTVATIIISNSTTPTAAPSPKETSSKGSMIFIILIAIAIVLLGGLMYYMFCGRKETTAEIVGPVVMIKSDKRATGAAQGSATPVTASVTSRSDQRSSPVSNQTVSAATVRSASLSPQPVKSVMKEGRGSEKRLS